MDAGVERRGVHQHQMVAGATADVLRDIAQLGRRSVMEALADDHRQGDRTNYIAYGPMVKGADKFVNPDILPHLPTAPQNTQNYFLNDAAFWADHRESTSARMATWMAK